MMRTYITTKTVEKANEEQIPEAIMLLRKGHKTQQAVTVYVSPINLVQ